jgi:glutaredoxin
MRRRCESLRGTLFALALLLLVPSAGADVLVLRDGTRLETRGPWQEKGRQLVFTDPAGGLSAIRADEVDLPASLAATARAAEPAPVEEKATPDERPVILTLDADDLGLGEDPDLSFDAGPRQVVLYSAVWCGVCRRTKELFDTIGLAYTDRDVDADPAARAERDRRSGGRQVVPVVDWGGEIIIGYNGARFLALAKEDAEAAVVRQRAAEAKEREERAATRRETSDSPDSAEDGFADDSATAEDSAGYEDADDSAAPDGEEGEPPGRPRAQPRYAS